MKTDDCNHPSCFGRLDEVFPKCPNGLRQTPERCSDCRFKVTCLREAVSGPGGFRVREEVIDRAYRTGVISFFERWSKKKYLQNQMKQTNRPNDHTQKGEGS